MSDTTSVGEGGITRPDPDIPDDPQGRWPSLRPINARTPLRSYFQEMWRQRDFAMAVPAGELKAQHQDTLLGQVWHLVNPLLLTGVYWLVFGTIFSRGMREGVPYIAFLVAGIIPFQFIQKSLMQGARLIHTNRNLIQSVHFPRAVLPFSAVAGELMAHGSAVLIMFIVVGLTDLLTSEAALAAESAAGVAPTLVSWWWLLVIPITLLQALFSLGLALFASRLTFHFRDIQNILPYVMRLAFYMSGIIFPLGTFTSDKPNLRRLLEANPINGIISLVRDAALRGTTDLGTWLVVIAWTVVLLVGGFVFFRAAETEYGRV